MADATYHIGQRLSLKGQLCTVRYVGPVADKPGHWLGVEWDDAARGKHNGTHAGHQYFTCKNPAPTAASFLKPKQPWDTPRTFLQALREKYMPENADTGGETVYFSSKQAEEVGFEKFWKRQKQLQGIHVIVLDQMRIHHDGSQKDDTEIRQLCGHVTELDLGRNLFESPEEILKLISCFPKLSGLTLDGNRLSLPQETSTMSPFPGLKSLALSSTLLSWQEISWLCKNFPDLTSLSAAQNGLTSVGQEPLPPNLRHLILSNNPFTSLSDIQHLSSCPTLETLSLKHCTISHVSNKKLSPESPQVHQTLHSLDLRENTISTWPFFTHLHPAFPALTHLQISNNPLYKTLTSAEGKPLTSEDGYMLTIARLPRLETLNYSTITEKERLNAETYYLGQIAAEISRAPAEEEAEIVSRHPRWGDLCSEYGEPTIQRERGAEDLDPNSLAAKLVAFNFFLNPGTLPQVATRSWEQEVPKSFNVYSLLGVVGKQIRVSPISLRLVWETEEEDLGQSEAYHGPEWWDSNDEEGDVPEQRGGAVSRSVELVAGTRPIGTYIESRQARVRVEQK